MILDLWTTLTNWSDQVKNWIFEHYENPALWIVLFFGLLCIVMMGYQALHRR